MRFVAVLELDVSDLLNIAEARERKIEQLSAEQELEIMSDMRLLLVAYCLLNYWTFDEIIARYDITPEQGLQLLRKLDRMKFIELQPGDRVRLLIANNFSWRKNGAIERFFRSRVQKEFFSHHFQDDDSIRIVKNGSLTRKSVLQLIEKLQASGELFRRCELGGAQAAGNRTQRHDNGARYSQLALRGVQGVGTLGMVNL